VPDCFDRPMDLNTWKDWEDKPYLVKQCDGDHLILLNVYKAYNENKKDPSWCSRTF
jgi:hypothetical protein